MRDRPDLDEMEPPPARPASRIDGMTDEEWAARRIRRDARFRILFGIVFGFAVALLASWHWLLVAPRYRVAGLLVFVGCMVLFPTLFARRRDDDAVEYAQWVAFTEWKFATKLPWWLLAGILGMALAMTVTLFIVIVAAVLTGGGP